VPDPEWIGDSPFIREGRDFVRTAFAFARAPHRFAARWMEDPQKWMNPVVFVATSAAITFAASRLADELLSDAAEKPHSPSFVGSLQTSLSPHAYYLTIAFLTHLMLRLFGSKRRWTTTAAMALYAGGTFASLAMLVVILAVVFLRWRWGVDYRQLSVAARVAVAIPPTLAFSAFLGTVLHRRGGDSPYDHLTDVHLPLRGAGSRRGAGEVRAAENDPAGDAAVAHRTDSHSGL
jgi:hypothetical protein